MSGAGMCWHVRDKVRKDVGVSSVQPHTFPLNELGAAGGFSVKE